MFQFYVVLLVRWALRACPALVEGWVGAGGRGESVGVKAVDSQALLGRLVLGNRGDSFLEPEKVSPEHSAWHTGLG